MSKAMRDAFGDHLLALGKDHPELVVLDADVSSSTKSAKFGKEYPERFFNTGVAEGNLAGVAAGLATCGYHPVINAFAIFLSLKSLDQINEAGRFAAAISKVENGVDAVMSDIERGWELL